MSGSLPPVPLALEHTYWVVDRQQQIYFVAQGGGHHEIPELFALVLPREGITVQVEGWSKAHGPFKKGGIEVLWDITSLEVAEPARVGRAENAGNWCTRHCKPTATTGMWP